MRLLKPFLTHHRIDYALINSQTSSASYSTSTLRRIRLTRKTFRTEYSCSSGTIRKAKFPRRYFLLKNCSNFSIFPNIWIFWEHYYYYYYKYWYFKNVIVISHFIIEDISMRIQNQSEFSKTKGKQTEHEFSLLRKDNATRCIIFGAHDGFCGLWNWQQMTVSHEVWDSMINEKYASVIM